MISQSENNIKKSALRFLKMYYKHRPRTGETKMKVDQITHDGVIADGLISFPQEDDKDFVASVEATSFDTRNEVKYQMQNHLLNWDSFMWGTAVVAIFALFGHYFHWFTFAHHEMQLVLFLGSLFGIIFLTHRYFFNKRIKYRYIYALQQFKQYHADEQWVAIGDNVFYGPKDPSLEELRKQCVQNGFGLLSVDKELSTHLVISPSRDELFGSSRKVLSFMGMESIAQGTTLKRAKGFWSFIKNKLGLGSSTGMTLARYQRNYFKPMLTSVLMLGLIGFVAYEDLREKDMNFVSDELEYDKELDEIAKNKPFNEFDQKIDTAYIAPKSKKVPDSYLAIVETEKRNDFIKERKPLAKEDELTPKGGNVEILVQSDNKDFMGYDCSRFFNTYGKKHVVQDSRFDNLAKAERRMELLKRSGFKPNLLWLGCFYEGKKEYIIYLEWLYETKDEAIKEGVEYRKDLKTKKIKEGELRIRTLEKK